VLWLSVTVSVLSWTRLVLPVLMIASVYYVLLSPSHRRLHILSSLIYTTIYAHPSSHPMHVFSLSRVSLFCTFLACY